MITKCSIGRLMAGDEVLEKVRGKIVSHGIVRSVRKNVERRNVTITFEDGGGWTQNWSAHVWVRRARP